MSKNLDYKQAANVERRTWDKATYEARAKAREEQQLSLGPVSSKKRLGGDPPQEDDKEEFRPAAEGSVGPEKSERAFLKARQGKIRKWEHQRWYPPKLWQRHPKGMPK
jgi:hypothetical protein